MELSQVVAAIKEISVPYADGRVNIFEVEPASLDGSTLRLRGRVLEEANRMALVRGLEERFPGLQIDAQAVDVARKPSNRQMAVGTNLTSMHAGTSFLAEQVTQMLNGTQVEVLWEQERWCFARQRDGYLGWTYLPYLTDELPSQPTHLALAPVSLLRGEGSREAALVTRVLGGTALCMLEQTGDWARVELAGGWNGWLPAGHLRALAALPQDAAARRAQLLKDAFTMIGVPYLWGGCSSNGIDCSGFAQLLHRWLGLTIPRDADMQYAAGKPVEPPFEPGDLLFFGEQGEKRRITHVGISLGGWRIIHSSRSRNGVQVDDVQQVEHLRDSWLCSATYIG